MSEFLIGIEKPTNIKPDSWYEEYLEIEDLIPCKIPEDAQVFYFFKEGELKNKIIKEDIDGDNNIFKCKPFVNKNNLESNKELLEECRNDIQSLPININLEDIENIDENSWEARIIESIFRLNKCEEILKQGYLITTQLLNIWGLIGECKYDLEEELKEDDSPNIYKQFRFDNYQEELSEFIKSNVNWLHKDRDFEIYNEIKDGTLYSEIAERLGCSISSISKINKKVQSSINNLKGRLFEIEYEKYLKSLNKFRNDKIIRDGNPGKPDIYIINNIKKELYIFSLKNLELNKKSFCITKEQLKPELKFAYNKSIFEGYKKVVLYMIVFDSLTEKLYVNELDFRNPSNVNIYH